MGQIALSGINASRQQIQIAEKNIAGSQTPGYQRVHANEMQEIVDGKGMGVRLGYERRDLEVENHLLVAARSLQSRLGYHESVQKSLTQEVNRIGTLENKENLSHLCQDFLGACADLSIKPSSTPNREAFFASAEKIISFLRDASKNHLKLRQQAEQHLDGEVQKVNNLLEAIKSTNKDIAPFLEAPPSLLSLRDDQMKELAKYMDFNIAKQDNGELYIQTKKGTLLVSGDTQPLSFQGTSGLDHSSTYPGTAEGLFIIDEFGNKIDITDEFTEGSMVGHLAVRDQFLPLIQEELDTFARVFMDKVNEINNKGTPFPPLSTLQGTTEIPGGLLEPFSGNGTLRLAIVQENGTLVDYRDVDISTFTSVGDLVTDFNTQLNAMDGTAGASLQGLDQHLELTIATPNLGIALVNVGGATIETGTGKGISHFFGLNDLIIGGDVADPGVAERLSLRKEHLSHGRLSDDPVPNVGDLVLFDGDNRVINDMIDMLKETHVFPKVDGGLEGENYTFMEYAASIIQELAGKASFQKESLASTQELLNQVDVQVANISGVSNLEEMQNLLRSVERHMALTKVLKAESKMMQSILDVT